jgi:hypothetical protein
VLRHGENVSDFTPDHPRDHRRFVERARPVSPDRAPVAQDRDAVAHLKHLVEFVRDVDHADAACAQIFQDSEERFDFRIGERGGRFV